MKFAVVEYIYKSQHKELAAKIRTLAKNIQNQIYASLQMIRISIHKARNYSSL
jgi:hypothetical protein